MDGSLLDAAVAAGADGIVVAATGAGNTDPSLLAAAVRAIEAGIPVALAIALPGGSRPARPTPSRVAARRGSGRGRSRSATCARSRPGSRSHSGSAPDWIAPGSARCSPIRNLTTVPLDMLITGRIATLAGDDGFGWVEADRHPRRADRLRRLRGRRSRRARTRSPSGSRSSPTRSRSRASPTRTSTSPARPTRRRQVDLTDAPTLDRGTGRGSAPRTRRSGDPDAWLEGHGWDVGSLGRLADRRRSRDGRARAGAARSGRTTITRCSPAGPRSRRPGSTARPTIRRGGVIRRDERRRTRRRAVRVGHPARHAPHPADARARAGGRIVAVSLELLALGVVAAHDPGRLVAGPGPRLVVPGLRAPVRARAAAGPRAGLVARRRARDGARRRPAQRRDPRREPDAVVPGSAGRSASPTGRSGRGPRRCWPTSNRNPTGRSRPSCGAACGSPSPTQLRERVERAAAGGIATQIHAHRRRGGPGRARRARADGRERAVHAQGRACPAAGPGGSRPVRRRRDRGERPALAPRAAMPLQARRLWGDRAERSGYAWGSIAATGAVLAFGTDAPVEPFDPWPGIALAVRREDPPLAGRHAAVRARRGAEHRARPARRLCRAGASRPASSIGAG